MLMPSGRFSQPFTCTDSTGLPTAPTGTPTAVLVKNGTDLGTTVTVTMSTANGIAICTIPSDAVADDRFHIRITAVITAITYTLAGPSDSVIGLQALTSVYDPAKTAAPTAAANAAAVRADQAVELARLDVAVGTRLATAGYTAPPSIAGLATSSALALVQVDTTAIKAKTDNLPASPAATGAAMTLTAPYDPAKTAAPTAAANAAAVRADQTVELARLDVAVGTRLATAGYTAPPSIAALATSSALALVQVDTTAIKAKTDNLPASPAATGAAMTLTSGERLTLAGVIETGFLDDLTGGTFLAGVQAQVQALFDSGVDVPVATIASTVAAAVRTNLATELARLDVAVGTRLATAGYTAPPSIASLATSSALALVQADTAAIKAKTDNLPASPAATGAAMALTSAYDPAKTAAPTAADNAAAVRADQAVELARLDVAVGTRLATAGYTAPPSIAALATSSALDSLSLSVADLPTVPEIATAILSNPTYTLYTDSEGHVTATNGGGGGSGPTFVMPLRATTAERVLPNRIDLFVREQVALTIAVYDDGLLPVDCTGLECTLFVASGIEIPGLVPTATNSGGVPHRYEFTPTAEMTATAGSFWFGLRVSDATERVLAFGHVVIADVP